MRFYIGQRVRIKWSHSWPELAGQEGTVVSNPLISNALYFLGAGHEVVHCAPDCWGSHRSPCPARNGAEFFSPMFEQLEPIQPSGWKKITWKEMEDLWSPSLTSSDAMA